MSANKHHHNKHCHTPEAIISIFNQTFYPAYNTKLVRGNDEPIYLPADETLD